MRFEIEADIPAGYEPTGEYRLPLAGEWVLDETAEQADLDWPSSPRLILREKPLTYADFKGTSSAVAVDESGYVRCSPLCSPPSFAREVASDLIAAADHVDRVNEQKDGAS